MSFNSLSFIIFLVVAFSLYWGLFSHKIKARNLFLLSASWLFYASWNWKLLFLLIFVSIVNFGAGYKIHISETSLKKKQWLWLCLALNLGVLIVFKYSNFVIGSFIGLADLFGFSLQSRAISVLLPVGISFYIFQGLSYSLDIYKGKAVPENNLISFFAFMAFFPQLVAGPIERARDLLPQFHEIKSFDYERTERGCFDILAGLFKKTVIADRLAVYVDSVWADPSASSGLPSIIAVVFFAFQLYLDFASYSQIACGTASLFGFKLHRNFNNPYLSVNFKEFWSRWHMTLQTWLRDYLYYPLGGNRKGRSRTWINILAVFTLSGLWHGPSWSFVIWGVINGLFLIIVDKIMHLEPEGYIARTASKLLVFILWSLSLVFFRAGSIGSSITMFRNLNLTGLSSLFSFGLSKVEFNFISGIIVLLLILENITNNRDEKIRDRFFRHASAIRWTVYLVFVLSIVYLGIYGNGSDNAFIYFQF